MAEVVELRIHGVGGTPPEDMLGVRADEIVRVGGESESAFYARIQDRSVEGFSWGALTSKPLLQPLWILLLPFTLMNVAGWTLPAKERSRFGGWQIARAIIVLLGLSLTISYVFGLSSIIVKQVFFQWGLNGLIRGPNARLFLGGLAMLGLGVLTLAIAGTTQRRFEQTDQRGEEPDVAAQRSLFSALFTQSAELSEPGFWENARAAKSLLRIHITVGILAALYYVIWGLGHMGGEAGSLDTAPLFAVLSAAQLLLAFLLLLACVLGFRNWVEQFVTRRFRAFAPLISASTAFGLAGGFIAGLSTVVGQVVGRFGTTGEEVRLAGPELKLNMAFGFGMLAFVVTGIGLAIFFLYWRARERADVLNGPINNAPPAQPPNGVPRTLIGRVAGARAAAGLLRHVDVLLTIPAIFFAFFAFVVVVDLMRDASMLPSFLGGVWDPGDIEAREVSILRFRFQLGTLSNAGDLMAALATAYVLRRLYKNYTDPGERRLIGILWDVLTFWPRRFHPLGVRPYAERAVPELHDRLVMHLRDHRRPVILSAHSQGTILAFAALEQIAGSFKKPLLKNLSFLTYGSPLERLHGNFFPASFSSERFANLEAALAEGAVVVGDSPMPISWSNFYRQTDYIGQHVEIGQNATHNRELADPPHEPAVPLRLSDPFGGGPDAPLPAWIGLALHSHYNRNATIKEWLTDVKATFPPTP